jgi:hypothetical protein
MVGKHFSITSGDTATLELEEELVLVDIQLRIRPHLIPSGISQVQDWHYLVNSSTNIRS